MYHDWNTHIIDRDIDNDDRLMLCDAWEDVTGESILDGDVLISTCDECGNAYLGCTLTMGNQADQLCFCHTCFRELHKPGSRALALNALDSLDSRHQLGKVVQQNHKWQIGEWVIVIVEEESWNCTVSTPIPLEHRKGLVTWGTTINVPTRIVEIMNPRT